MGRIRLVRVCTKHVVYLSNFIVSKALSKYYVFYIYRAIKDTETFDAKDVAAVKRLIL
jgi:hypothetical protein